VYAQTGVYFTNLGATSNLGALLPGYHLLNFRYEWANLSGLLLGNELGISMTQDRPSWSWILLGRCG
jgi:hypothetical protein